MKVTRKQKHIIRRALDDWKQQGRITDSEHAKLAATLNTVAFDWQRLSRYAFWTATACVLTALAAFFADSLLAYSLLTLFSSSGLL
ncbi:TPA: DUF2157 domain-containing protein, partial [Citrobacter amalonaticus]